MRYEPFELERWLSTHKAKYNLSGLGPPSVRLSEIVSPQELDKELLYGNTQGSEELRTLIAQTYGKIESNNVLVTTGTAEANYLTLTSLVEPGDEAIMIVPTYMQAYGLVRALGAQVKLVHLDEKQNYKVPIEELKNALSSKTKLIFYTNPNNPTGATMQRADVEAICELAEDKRAFVVCDEVLRGLEMNGALSTSPVDIYEKGISTGSLSKLGIRGIRIGWLAAPDSKTIQQTWSLKDYTTLSHSGLSENIASAAMKPDRLDWLRERARKSFRDGRKLLVHWVKENSNVLGCVLPSAGGSAFPLYSANIDSVVLAESLLKQEDVLVAPGAYFGSDRHFRIKFVPDDMQKLLEGFARVGRFLRRQSL
jgi:aspartate/methionine/tyrosine aminotransferase